MMADYAFPATDCFGEMLLKGVVLAHNALIFINNYVLMIIS